MGVAAGFEPTSTGGLARHDDVIEQPTDDPLVHVVGVDEEVAQFNHMVSSDRGETDEVALGIGRSHPAEKRRIVGPGEDQDLRTVQQGSVVGGIGQ